MSTNADYEAIPGMDLAGQRAWMQSLRPRTAAVELVFHIDDATHPLTQELAWLAPVHQHGVGTRPGYPRPQPRAVLHRYPYDRAVVRALDGLGGLFEWVSAPRGDTVRLTRLGDVDVTFLDSSDTVLGSTVTHEGLILSPVGPPAALG